MTNHTYRGYTAVIAFTRGHHYREDFEAALRGLTVEHLSSGNVEQSLWLCPLEDRGGRDGTREGMLSGLSLPKYLLLLDYTSRVARAGKASLSAEVAPIFERLGTTADKWTQRVTRLSQIFQGRRITGQFFATTREALEQLAQRLGKCRLINLTGSGPTVSVAATATST